MVLSKIAIAGSRALNTFKMVFNKFMKGIMTWLSVMAGAGSGQLITGTKETGLERNYCNNLICTSQICVLWVEGVEK